MPRSKKVLPQDFSEAWDAEIPRRGRGVEPETEAQAMRLLSYLEEHAAGAPREILFAVLELQPDWKGDSSRWQSILAQARRMAKTLELSIPQPVAADGFCYRLTGSWISSDIQPGIFDSVWVRVQDELTRRSTTRDHLDAARRHTNPNSKEGRVIAQLMAMIQGEIAQLTVMLETLRQD